MFENFPLPERDRAVVGYRFSCDRPVHVMCLIHGIGEHAGRYQRMAAALAEKQIAVVSMDLRGHGISPGVRGDTAPREEVLADIDALILRAQEFYPGLPITLFGHSKGGNICLDYKPEAISTARRPNILFLPLGFFLLVLYRSLCTFL